MAKAEVIPEKVEIIRKVISEKSVTLTLTEDEAKFLASICRRIGGCQMYSRRKYSDSISMVLERVGISGYTGDIHGNLQFSEVNKRLDG